MKNAKWFTTGLMTGSVITLITTNIAPSLIAPALITAGVIACTTTGALIAYLLLTKGAQLATPTRNLEQTTTASLTRAFTAGSVTATRYRNNNTPSNPYVINATQQLPPIETWHNDE